LVYSILGVLLWTPFVVMPLKYQQPICVLDIEACAELFKWLRNISRFIGQEQLAVNLGLAMTEALQKIKYRLMNQVHGKLLLAHKP
jgi:hypothetical protein